MQTRSKRQLLVAQHLLMFIERNANGSCDACKQVGHSPTCAVGEAARALSRIIPTAADQAEWLKST